MNEPARRVGRVERSQRQQQKRCRRQEPKRHDAGLTARLVPGRIGRHDLLRTEMRECKVRGGNFVKSHAPTTMPGRVHARAGQSVKSHLSSSAAGVGRLASAIVRVRHFAGRQIRSRPRGESLRQSGMACRAPRWCNCSRRKSSTRRRGGHFGATLWTHSIVKREFRGTVCVESANFADKTSGLSRATLLASKKNRG
jgi:hypothetical protein